MLVCECVLKRKKRGAGMALVLSDCESMNKKLISLFQGTLAATSETVPSQRSRGGAAECVCVSVFTMGCFQSISDCYLHNE